MIKIHRWPDDTICFPEDESIEEYLVWKSDDYETLEFTDHEAMENFLKEVKYHEY